MKTTVHAHLSCRRPGLPEIDICPIGKRLILRQQPRRGGMLHDALPRLPKHTLRHGMAEHPTDLSLAEPARPADVRKRRFLPDGEGSGDAVVHDDVQADEIVLLERGKAVGEKSASSTTSRCTPCHHRGKREANPLGLQCLLRPLHEQLELVGSLHDGSACAAQHFR